jgi:hypothetical protein
LAWARGFAWHGGGGCFFAAIAAVLDKPMQATARHAPAIRMRCGCEVVEDDRTRMAVSLRVEAKTRIACRSDRFIPSKRQLVQYPTATAGFRRLRLVTRRRRAIALFGNRVPPH